MLPQSIRIKFKKVGRLKFISHLDLCRTLKTAIVRAKIPIWYTQGFNPHPKMVFALTVSVGSESICEYLDIKITQDMPFDEIKDRLNGALTDELSVDEVYAPQNDFSEIGYSSYVIKMNDLTDTAGVEEKLASSMVVLKHTKSGEREVDIRPLIRSYSFVSSDDGIVMGVVLSADSSNYLNPDYVAKALGSADYDAMRTGVILKDGVTQFR